MKAMLCAIIAMGFVVGTGTSSYAQTGRAWKQSSTGALEPVLRPLLLTFWAVPE